MTGVDAPVFCFRYNPNMRWNRWFGIGLAVLSAACLVISIWPISHHTDQVRFTSSEGIAGTLLVTLPDQMHVGDKSSISLNISMDQDPIINKQLTFLSKLEMDNLSVAPNGEGRVSIDPSKSFTLQWQIEPQKTGASSGTLWLFMETATGERDLILAKPVELKAKTLIGFSFRMAKYASIAGLIAGIAIYLVKIKNKLF